MIDLRPSVSFLDETRMIVATEITLEGRRRRRRRRKKSMSLIGLRARVGVVGWSRHARKERFAASRAPNWRIKTIGS